MAKKYYRSSGDKMIVGGVCGGLARYLDWDPTLVRIIGAVLILFTNGIGLLAYILTWVLAPEDEGGEESAHVDSEQRRKIIGGVLIGVGGLLLIGRFVLWFDFRIIMAVVLVVAGIYIIVQKR